MSKKRGGKRKPANSTEIASQIRGELRSIFRRIDELRRPFDKFEVVADQPENEPRYRLVGADSYEVIHEKLTFLAGSVWHLKDPINRWLSSAQKACDPPVDELARSHPALCICADLIDTKKHGGHDNKSGYDPKLAGISIRPNGQIGLRYDGSIAVGEILVMKPEPVTYEVNIATGDGKAHFGNAIDVICKALGPWIELLNKANFLSGGDPQVTKLREMFDRFKNGLSPIMTSDLVPL